MEKKKKLAGSELLQATDGSAKTTDEPPISSDLSTMRDVIIQFQDEADNEDGLSIVFHVSILWPLSIINPGIKVSIRLKDEEEDDDVASWERMMHHSNTNGWELTLGHILKSAKEMKIDYLIVENVDGKEQHQGWLQ